MTGLCCGSRPCIASSLNQLILSPECVCCSLCEPDRPTPVASECSRDLLQLVPVTRIEKFVMNEGSDKEGK